MTPKRTNRISAREAALIVRPIRKSFTNLRAGMAFDLDGALAFQDWKGEVTRFDQALLGWSDCWRRFGCADIDLGPIDELRRLIEQGEPLTFQDLDAALAVLRQQERKLTKLPRDFIKAKTNDELIQIELDQLGLTNQE